MISKILFITGSLEAGKGGVSDYILRLAWALKQHGISSVCVAINDTFISSTIRTVSYSVEDSIDLVRMSSQLPWRGRTLMLKDQISTFNPDFISLQYVSYSFDSKGLPLSLISCLNDVKYLAPWQVMVHELWVESKSGPKQRILSFIQRVLTIYLFRRLRPSVFHTSNHWYQKLLRNHNVESSILPIFSNIPFYPSIPLPSNYALTWKFILFGSIYHEWDPWSLLSQIEVARKLSSIASCSFIAIGNIGDYGNKLWDSLQNYSNPNFTFSRLGELSAEQISQQLLNADFGITVAPSHLVEKSSSAAAMLSHGLPVIISRLSSEFSEWNNMLDDSGKYILLDSSFTQNLRTAYKFSPSNELEYTAVQFIKELDEALLASLAYDLDVRL